MKPVAIVTPWFGSELKGGAEQQAWQLATRLAGRGHAIDVLTTCSRAFLDDWAVNYYQPGSQKLENFRILRFRVDKRQRQEFDRVNGLMLISTTLQSGVNPVTLADANIFSAENINSTDLLNYLKMHEDDYHAFIFLPYLYGPILNGLPLVASKAFLQPCLHNEVYAYLPAVANIFHKTKGLLFISAGEAQLAQQLYGPGIIPKSTVVGAGVEINDSDNAAISDINHFQVKQERFVLYLGRRDATKNTNLVVQAYTLFKQKFPDSTLKLVLAGPGNASYDSVTGVIDLGLVAEAEKAALLAHCIALFQPSRNESYSRVMMEAWFYEKPVAAHRECLATAIAVKSSQGGWLAATPTEWQGLFAQIDTLEPAQLAEYGANGRKYAQDHASWDKIIERYETVLGLSATPAQTVAASHPRKLAAIHQLLPNLNYGDAISNHALFIRNRLREYGYDSEIFVRYIDPVVAHEAKVFQPDAIDPQSGLIYHHSIGSELTPYAIAHSGPKCLIYHNITPANFFEPYRPDFAKILETGRAELGQLATYFTFSVGDSAYNAAELAASGFAAPSVLPIAVAPNKWDIPADESFMAQLQDGKTNILFVGRLAPNKCQHDLIKAFAQYITLDPHARLILAGSGASTDPYYNHLINTIEALNLTEILITGQVNDAQLLALYRTAHLFWSMSEHEGFCVPLIEAMWFDIPVLAYKSSVIPETLSNAGIMFTCKDDLLYVAALAKLLVKDQALQKKVINAQQKRREFFLPSARISDLNNIISNLEQTN